VAPTAPKREPPKPELPKGVKPEKASTPPKAKPLRDDPQRGVKEALERIKQKIAADLAEISEHAKQISETERKVFTLKKKVEETPRSDPNRAKMLEEHRAAQERLRELKERQEHREALNKLDQGTQDRLQKALDAKTYDRPQFREGVRDEVWQTALKEGKGKVLSPSGTEIKPGDPWVMGHKAKYEFWKHQASAAERGISREQFIEEYNDPRQYRPETEEDSASHKYEDRTDAYLGY
jgi:hypothetical protein